MHDHWVVINVSDGELFWSNNQGWGDQLNASWFSDTDRVRYDLPMSGEWLRIEE